MTYARSSAGTTGVLQICLPVSLSVTPSITNWDNLGLNNGFPMPSSGISNIKQQQNIVSLDYDPGGDNSVPFYGIAFLQTLSSDARLSFDAEL